MELVAQTSVIIIHGHGGILDSLWEIIDVDEEGGGPRHKPFGTLCALSLIPRH